MLSHQGIEVFKSEKQSQLSSWLGQGEYRVPERYLGAWVGFFRANLWGLGRTSSRLAV